MSVENCCGPEAAVPDRNASMTVVSLLHPALPCGALDIRNTDACVRGSRTSALRRSELVKKKSNVGFEFMLMERGLKMSRGGA